MRNLDFNMAVISLILHLLANRVHYFSSMKSYEDEAKSIFYSTLSFIARISNKILLMFFTYSFIMLTISLKEYNLEPYMISLLTFTLIYLIGTKANEKLLNEAYEKISKLKG